MNVPLIIGIIILLAVIGGGGYWYFFMRRVYEGPSDCTVDSCIIADKVLVSPNGSYKLQLLKTGNLTIIDRSGKIIWETKTSSVDPCVLKMYGDGNLALVVQKSEKPLWSSMSYGKGGIGPFTLRLDDKGHLNILNNNKSVLWST